MKTILIGSVVEDKTFDEILRKSKNIKPSIAGQRFEKMIARGLSCHSEIEILSYLPIPTFPNHKIIFSKKKRGYIGHAPLSYIPIINIAFLKQFVIMLYTFFYLLYWCLKNYNKKKSILLPLVYVPTAIPALFFSKVFSIPVVVIVPDVSTYRFSYTENKSFFKRILFKGFRKISEGIDKEFDGYVFLTEQMNELMNKKNKPFIVIEGMISEIYQNETNKSITQTNKLPVIMYAGSLRKKYGIAKLIEAFNQIDNKEFQLWIFGSGDYETNIVKMTKENTNIKFFGLKPQDEVYEYEKQVKLLVNPRPSNEEFTKYSFPSKTLEYMSSGTPLLTTKLPGIPKDYDEYLFWFDDESVEGIKEKIVEVLHYDQSFLDNFGKRAKKYVEENKNYIAQTKKIYDFLNKLM